jgi:hypothetical protein
MTIPSGVTTWQSDPNSSSTSPARSEITPAKVTARQSGLQREVTPPPSFAKSPCGGAANGINPQDLRPTGGTQLETLPALWKQHLDRQIAPAADSSVNARFDERQAAHTALKRRHDDTKRHYQTRGQRPNGPAAPGR